MEAAALGGTIEDAVERLIPPAAREAVLGDLRETCSSRGAYMREILKIAPFVIVSQMLRHLNLPVLLLREAYQPLTRPDARAALRNAMRLSFAGLFLGLLTPAPLQAAVALALLSGPFSLLLCGLRTGLIISMDRCEANLPDSMALAELRAFRDGFRVRLRQRRRLEMVALGLGALCWPKMIGAPLGVALGAVFLAAALYLFHLHMSGGDEEAMDFHALRHRYV